MKGLKNIGKILGLIIKYGTVITAALAALNVFQDELKKAKIIDEEPA